MHTVFRTQSDPAWAGAQGHGSQGPGKWLPGREWACFILEVAGSPGDLQSHFCLQSEAQIGERRETRNRESK